MSADKKQSKDPLMGKETHRYSEVSASESSDDVIFDIDLESKRRRLSKLKHLTPYLIHGFLIILYTSLFVAAYSRANSSPQDVDDLGIPYVKKIFEVNPALNDSIARIYTGEPSEELDAAWARLLKYSNIRIPEDEIRRLDRLEETVKFTDGSGYFGQMTMYHHLHCIMRVHHYLHVEHYWPNATADDLYLLRAHNFHCLDTLRQAIQCQGDTSLITFYFGQTQPIPLGNFSSLHRCKSWDALDNYNRDHFVDVFKPDLVVHPKFGWAYKGDDEAHGTGVVVEEGKIENGQGKIGGREAEAAAEAHHKGVDDGKIEMTAEAREKMKLAWSREKVKRGQAAQEGRKGKVAGDAPNGSWKREKPPAKKVSRHAPDKWEDPLPKHDW